VVHNTEEGSGNVSGLSAYIYLIHIMSSTAAASSYWRVAGMTYLKYSNVCADMVRSALKEPAKGVAKAREAIYFRSSVWKDGAPQQQVITDITEGTSGKLS